MIARKSPAMIEAEIIVLEQEIQGMLKEVMS